MASKQSSKRRSTAASKLNEGDASAITQTPEYLKWVKETDKKYGLESPALQPHLGSARQGKADELRSKEKIDRDVKRLSTQGLQVGSATLRRAADEAAATPVEVRGSLPMGVRGMHDRKKKKIMIADNVMNPKKGEDPKGSWQGKRTLRHEQEHAYDEAAGLSKMQAPLLDKLGAHQGDDDHDHTKHSSLSDERLYDRSHMRIGVMHMREDLGKDFLDATDLEEILKLGKERKSRMYLERMIEQNPDADLQDLSKLINQVAAREKAATEMQA